MAQRNKTNFNALYGQPSGATFPDNTSQEISESDMRDFGTDIKDSALFIDDNFIDEDSFASDSATKAPSQQSVKAYVDTQINSNLAGLNWKQSVKAATTANITLSGEQTIDGIALVAGDRCLVKNQSTASQNGIYLVSASSWTRSTDNDSTAEMQNAVVSVDQGTTNADTSWRQQTDSVTVGSSNVVWVSFGASGITNSAANDEVPKGSSGNLTGTKVYSTTNGNLRLGDTGLAGSERELSVEGSSASVSLRISPKGLGASFVLGSTSATLVTVQSNNGVEFRLQGTPITLRSNSVVNIQSWTLTARAQWAFSMTTGVLSSTTASDYVASDCFEVRGFDGFSGQDGRNLLLTGGPGTASIPVPDVDGGHVYIDGGTPAGTGVYGNVAFFARSSVNFQSGVRIIYIKEADTIPSGNPTDGGFLFVDPADGALKYRGSSGTVTTIANA